MCQNPLCQKSFIKSHQAKTTPKYCSMECTEKCSPFHKKIKNIPDKEELLEMHQIMNWGQIAKKYGVTRRAVYKWRKKYNILPEKYNILPERKRESQS